MSDPSKYTIKCSEGNCKKDVKVFKALVDNNPPPLAKNVNRWYYSCGETNNCKCKFFRWMEYKWPKVKHMYQHTEVESISSPIENEMQSLIGQLQYVDIGELSSKDKSDINNLVLQLEQKITGSLINITKKDIYLKTLNDLKNIVK